MNTICLLGIGIFLSLLISITVLAFISPPKMAFFKFLILVGCTILSSFGMAPLFVIPHDIIVSNQTGWKLTYSIFGFIVFSTVWISYFTVSGYWLADKIAPSWIRKLMLFTAFLCEASALFIGLIFTFPVVIHALFMCGYLPWKPVGYEAKNVGKGDINTQQRFLGNPGRLA